MASSLETNKLLAGVLTAGIIAVGAGVIAGILYHPAGLEENAFNVIEAGAEGGETVETANAPVETPIEMLLASADPAAGEAITRQCTACHVFQEGGDNRIGPGLWNVVGSDIASHAGFSYSDALQGKEGNWTYEALNGFLAAPREWAPGTAMSYAGVRDDQDRANLIAYLRTLSNDPVPLPEPAAEQPAAAEEPAAADATAAAAEPAAEAAPAAETDVAATEVPAESEETAVVDATAEEAAQAAAAEDAAAGAEAVVAAEEPVVAEAQADEAAQTAAAEDAAAGAEAVVAAEEPVVAEAQADEAAAAEDAAAGAPAVSEETAVVEAEAEAPAAEAAGEASPMVAKVAAADPADGEKVFRQCSACHVADQGGANRVGPNLWGVFGADIATHEGFNYSDALKGLEGNWTVDKLNEYLTNPRAYAPGSRMAFAGLRSEEDRAAVIAYLHSLSENPVPLQ